MTKNFFCFFLFFYCIKVHSQKVSDSLSKIKYDTFIQTGDSLKELGLNRKAADYYVQGFNLFKDVHPKSNWNQEAYKIAQVFGLLNDFDSVRYYLKYSVFYDSAAFWQDTSFYSFNHSQREILDKMVIASRDELTKILKVDVLNVEIPLIASKNTIIWARQLDSILEEDQKYRKLLERKELDITLSNYMRITDSSNLKWMMDFIAKNGWPGNAVVGQRRTSTAFLIFQHAPFDIQLKYYALLENAYKTGNLLAPDFALFQDRVSNSKNGYQIYGSQVAVIGNGKYKLYPIIDEKNVNERRKKMRMGPLEEYLKQFGIEYKVPQ